MEQAKGIIAARTGLDVDTAFAVLSPPRRKRNRRLADAAAAVVDGALDIGRLVEGPPHGLPR